MTYLRDVAKTIRSKNSGPFKLTFDVMFPDLETFHSAMNSGSLGEEEVLEVLGYDRSELVVYEWYEPVKSLKVTVRRSIPSGGPGCTDVYGCQQSMPLETIVLDVSRS